VRLRLVDFMRPRDQPVGELQIIRMIFVGHPKRRQAPGIFQFWIQRKLLFSTGNEVPCVETSIVRVKSCASAALKSLPHLAVPGGQAPNAKPYGV